MLPVNMGKESVTFTSRGKNGHTEKKRRKTGKYFKLQVIGSYLNAS
jgi:hypothetical protein